MYVCVIFMSPLNARYFFLSHLPTNSEGSVPCFQIPRLGSVCVCVCVCVCVSLHSNVAYATTEYKHSHIFL